MRHLCKAVFIWLSWLCLVAPATSATVTPAQAAAEVQAADDLPATEAEVSPPVDIWDRIRRGFSMPALNNRRVAQSIRSYSRNPKNIERTFNRAGKYLYHIVEEIEKRGLPTELALLPFVESAFQPEALSHAKAAGLWQFMPATGNIFSLQQNFWKDERRDVLESTRAALDYLQQLHATFGDWQLALAAYNWGEGRVSRAIRRNKARHRPANYSNLRMPRETAYYVPRLEAIKRIVENPEKYGITLPAIDNRIVEKLPSSDMAYLQNLYQQINAVEPIRVEATCPHCGEKFKVEVSLLGE